MMNSHLAQPRTLVILLLAAALAACGGSPPPVTGPVSETQVECESYQELRDGACVYVVEAERRCMAADRAACTVAGHAYMSGEEVAVDQAHAAELYALACSGDDAEGCASLADLHVEGEGVEQSAAEAARLYSLACELGDGRSCTAFASCLASAYGVPHDLTRAGSYYERGCAGGDAEGCGALGVAYLRGEGVERNAPHGAELLGRACEDDFVVACVDLGLALERDAGLPRDGARAMELYDRACRMNEPWGCYHVGRALAEGAIVPFDLERGRAVLSETCERGVEPACELAGALAAPAPTPEQTAASCSAPTRLTLGREVTGTTADAVNGLTATCGLLASSPERVFTLVVTRPTRVKADLFARFDGVVHIRSACSVAPDTQVACNDDAVGDESSAEERHSHVEVELQRGTYFVVVDGYGEDASGTFRLTVDRAP